MMLWFIAALGVQAEFTAFKYRCNLMDIVTDEKTCDDVGDKNETSGEASRCMVKECTKCSNATMEHRHTGIDECIKREIFHEDFVVVDLVALYIWFIGSGICISAGVGGSALFTPLGLLLLQYDLLSATAISQFANFGASLAAVLLNSCAQHPLCNRPLINYELVLYMGPLLLSGTLLGFVGQTVLQTWMLLIIMVVVLGYTSFNTFMAARNRREKDRCAQSTPKSMCKKTSRSSSTVDSRSDKQPSEGSLERARPVLRKGRRKDSSLRFVGGALHSKTTWAEVDASVPSVSYAYLMVMWVGSLLLLFVRGSSKMESIIGIAPCSIYYWICWLISVTWLCIWGFLMGLRLVSKSMRRMIAGVDTVDGDISWTHGKLTGTSFGVFLAGILAALMGSGGGTVLGPLMLHLKVHPQVSSASAATMVMFTSSSLSIIYLLSGIITSSVALTFFSAAFMGSLLGKSVIDDWVKKKKLTWVLIAILSGIIALGTIMSLISGLLLYKERDWNFETELNPPCG